MRRILHPLLVLAVLACGLEIGEAGGAHAAVERPVATADRSAPADDADHPATEQTADSGHHHCPVAPVLAAMTLPGRDRPRPILVAPAAVALGSFAQAPPTQPPSA